MPMHQEQPLEKCEHKQKASWETGKLLITVIIELSAYGLAASVREKVLKLSVVAPIG